MFAGLNFGKLDRFIAVNDFYSTVQQPSSQKEFINLHHNFYISWSHKNHFCKLDHIITKNDLAYLKNQKFELS